MRKLIIIIFCFPTVNICSQTSNSFIDYVSFYQKRISSLRNVECKMYPNCSTYGLQSFKYHNNFKAIILTSDRIIRCGQDLSFYKEIQKNNKTKYIDLPKKSDSLKRSLINNEEVIFKTNKKRLNDTCNIGFIRFLVNNNNYREAIIEVNKQIYYHKCKIPELFIILINCKKNLGETSDFIDNYFNHFPLCIRNNRDVLFETANLLYADHNYDKAFDFYQKALAVSKYNNSNYINKINIMLGVTTASLFNFQKSKIFFNSIEYSSRYYNDALKSIKTINQQESFPYKKPTLAGFLSVVPGLGYLYSGHKSSAISSFLVNSLLGYALYSNIINDNYGMAVLTGGLTLSFYLGNITGSINSAKRYNKKIDNNFSNQIKNHFY